jgi:hypothetical protein
MVKNFALSGNKAIYPNYEVGFVTILTSVRQTGVTLFTGDHIRLVPFRALWVSLFALFVLHLM